MQDIAACISDQRDESGALLACILLVGAGDA